MHNNLLIHFKYNDNCILHGYRVLVFGLAFIAFNLILNYTVLEYISIIVIGLGLSEIIVLNNRIILSVFEHHLEFNVGPLYPKKIIEIKNIQNIVKGKQAYVINLKSTEKPIIIMLQRFNQEDIPYFRSTMEELSNIE